MAALNQHQSINWETIELIARYRTQAVVGIGKSPMNRITTALSLLIKRYEIKLKMNNLKYG